MKERNGLKGRIKSEEREEGEEGDEADAVGEGEREGKSLGGGGARGVEQAGLGGRNASQQRRALPSLKGKLRSNFGLVSLDEEPRSRGPIKT